MKTTEWHPRMVLTCGGLHRSVLAVMVAGTLGACINPQETSRGPAPTISRAMEIDDSLIAKKVRSALLGDSYIRNFELAVSSHKGRVQISGFVANPFQLDHALALVQSVDGVTSVDNHLSLKPGSAMLGNVSADRAVRSRIKTALRADPEIRNFSIGVITHRGDVQLSGYVDNPTQKDAATRIVRSVDGVRSVGNELSLRN